MEEETRYAIVDGPNGDNASGDAWSVQQISAQRARDERRGRLYVTNPAFRAEQDRLDRAAEAVLATGDCAAYTQAVMAARALVDDPWID